MQIGEIIAITFKQEPPQPPPIFLRHKVLVLSKLFEFSLNIVYFLLDVLNLFLSAFQLHIIFKLTRTNLQET